MRLFSILAAVCLAVGIPVLRGVLPQASDRASDRAPAALGVGRFEARLRELPDWDGTDAAFRSKYRGMTAEELDEAYGILRSIYYEESRPHVEERLRDGLYEQEVCDRAAMAEMAKRLQGKGTRSVGCTARPLGDGQFLVKTVELPEGLFPALHVRMLETEWVHDQVHLLDACTFCCSEPVFPPPSGR